MLIGVTLPQFRESAEPALEAAQRARGVELDGVFVFDHLWPLHEPDRPALHSLALLGALAGEVADVAVGTLVARVSLLPNAVLANALSTVRRIVGDRLIAGLGAGDRNNRDENLAYGIPFPPKGQRLADLAACCRLLGEAGVRTWIGGVSEDVRALAAAEADGWNRWGADAATFGREADDVRLRAGGRDVEVTWGGQVLIGRDESAAADKLARYGDRPGLVHGSVEQVGRHFSALREAGATWAVCAPLDVGDDRAALATLREAASMRDSLP